MIELSKHDGIAILKLNRPEKRNALHPTMVLQIKGRLAEISQDKETKALIITGEGSSFCAGADLEHLHELLNYSTIANEKDSESLAEMFSIIYNMSIPTIAAVNGPAIAGGCGLVSVCDFVIADLNNAKFGFSEVSIGFAPAIVSIFLIKKIGLRNAKRMLLTSEVVAADEAKVLGLVDFLSNNVLEDSIGFAKKLSKNSRSSYSYTKQMLNDISDLNIDEAVNYCVQLNTISRSSEDFRERIKKFLNK